VRPAHDAHTRIEEFPLPKIDSVRVFEPRPEIEDGSPDVLAFEVERETARKMRDDRKIFFINHGRDARMERSYARQVQEAIGAKPETPSTGSNIPHITAAETRHFGLASKYKSFEPTDPEEVIEKKLAHTRAVRQKIRNWPLVCERDPKNGGAKAAMVAPA
jgi:hypothetical protein